MRGLYRLFACVRLGALAALGAWAPALALAETSGTSGFQDIATFTNTVSTTAGHLCSSYDDANIGCAATSPYVSSGGLLGIGTTNPSTQLEVVGTVSATHFVGDGSGLTGVIASTGDRVVSGTTSLVAFQTSGLISITQAGTNTAYFHPSLGLVTIGVSSTGTISGTYGFFKGIGINTIPNSTYQLDIFGTIRVSSYVAGNQYFAAENQGLSWGTTDAVRGSANNHYLTFTTSNTEAMRIVSTAYVGIGTTSPSKRLTVLGDILMNSGEFYRNMYWNGTNWIYGIANSPGFVIRTANTSDTNFYVAPGGAVGGVASVKSPIYMEGSTGNVGINMGVPPSTTLHVSGTIRMADGGESCDANRLGAIKYSGGDFSVCRNGSSWETLASIASSAATVTDGASGSLVFRDGTGILHATSTLSISSTTGSVGIGAGAPAWMGNNGLYAMGSIGAQGMLVAGQSFLLNTLGSASINFYTSQTQIMGDSNLKYLAFTPSGTEAMRIVSTGNVGIGTTTPNAKLEVNGTVSATNLAIGQNITTGGNIAANSNLNIGGTGTFNGLVSANAGISSTQVSATRVYGQYASFTTITGGTINGTFVGDGSGLTGVIASTGDRVVSGTTSLVAFQSSGLISITQAGTNTAYFHPSLGLVTIGVSSTGGISATTGYFTSNVGIGTTNPASALDVRGDIAGASFTISNTSQYQTLSFNKNGSAKFQIVNDNSWVTTLQNMDNRDLRLAISGTEIMRFKTSGNIGIGTTNPTTALEVSGSIKSSGVVQVSGTVAEGCTSDSDIGKIRVNPATNHFQICRKLN